MMSLASCISRCPSTTRCPWLVNSLLPTYGSSTDGCASLACMNSGSSPSRPSRRRIQARVPTLPTPTTFRAASTNRYRSSSRRRSRGSVRRYDRIRFRIPSQVPFERPRQRLVEVVDAEHQPAVGSGEDAEVGQVRVAAELRVEPGAWPVGQIGRHDEGGSAEERERRDQHPPVPDWNELGN